MGIKSLIPCTWQNGLHIEMGLLFLSDTKASANATTVTIQFQVLQSSFHALGRYQDLTNNMGFLICGLFQHKAAVLQV